MNQHPNLWIPSATHRLWGHGGIYRGVVKTRDKAFDTDRPDYPHQTEAKQFGDAHLPAAADVFLGTWLPTRVSAKVHGLHGEDSNFADGNSTSGVYAISITEATIASFHIEDQGDTVTLSEKAAKNRKKSKATKKKSTARSSPKTNEKTQETPTKAATEALSKTQLATPSKTTPKPQSSTPQSGDKRNSQTAGLLDEDDESKEKNVAGNRKVSADDLHQMRELSQAFQTSFELGNPIRVLRGGPVREGSFPISFRKGFRYDGLYTIVGRKFDVRSDETNCWIWTLERVPGQKALSEIQDSSPTQSQLDDFIKCVEQWKDCRENGWSMPT
ncbi:hypothetical protein CKM354_000124200 [Cercospora kikuchii]|uniref:YDG domain-containing protein n=1 Tax=Cercospora kikuchii TaxID=84275 RepID=A0A9P3C7N4_9PEZI|nr:uncharacterized protein CKM354_000124200 [Cercospora kikuchii]GIZ37808.1 hypothetical protein CKM354_000124200 [Cercospora kikuchii]